MHDLLTLILTFLSGLIIGGALVWFVARLRFHTENQLANSFKALAADSLRQSSADFLQLAENRLKQSEQIAAASLDKKTTAIDEMVKPMKESLHKLDQQLQALEVKREGAYRELTEIVKLSHETHQQLRGETSQLLQALRTPTSRGRWGEMQLRRILEMTGMSAHAKDFSEQQTLTGEDGLLRPDFIVHLPAERCIIIDSKVPLASYLDATQAHDDTTRQNALKQHARQVREHMKLLSAKAYWDQVQGTPEFVVLFMPGDHFLSAALDIDPHLMDDCIGMKVVLATPMTLIGLLRTVAYGWRQESLGDNVRKIGLLGGELYTAILAMTTHITSLGNKLSSSLESYNSMIGSLERNVLSKARRLRDFGAGKDGKALPETLEPIDLQPRSLTTSSPTSNDDAA